MPRFVVLQHDHPDRLHWDFMLEAGETLATWALESPPAYGQTISATALADHRRAYLDYEGEISGGRGTVARWDAGTYELVSRYVDCWTVRLHGEKLVGTLRLERQPESGDAWHWRLVSE